jgi:hypothetical protein
MAKLGISIADEDLRWLERRAKRLHGGNLSAAVAEQTRLARHHEALGVMLDRLGAPKLSGSESDASIAEIDGREKKAKRRKRAA